MNTTWDHKQLGEICDVVNGGTPKTGVAKYWDGDNLWITPAEMGKRLSPFVDDTERKLTELGIRESSARILPPNSVILSSRAPIGHLVINTNPMATNQGCKGLVPSGQIYSKFLYYYLHSIVEVLKSLGTGTTFMEISGGTLKQVPIPTPPLPEQKRIVGILDQAFDAIATAKANTEKNLQNARALFDSQLNSALNPRAGAWRPLVEMCALFVDSAHRTPDYQAEGIPAIRPRDVVNGKLTFENVARVSKGEYDIQSKRCRPTGGDIVYSRELSYGWAAVLPESPKVCLSQGMCLFRPTREMDRTFLVYVLNSVIGREQASRAAVGAAHPHINLGDIKAYRIPVPPIDEQVEIVRQLDALRVETGHLESICQQKLDALDSLRRSLLHQAFTGEL